MRNKFQEIENNVYDRSKRSLKNTRLELQLKNYKSSGMKMKVQCVEDGEEDDMSPKFLRIKKENS